jgi:manganese/zinc/iron transport system permease protein
MGVVFSVMFAVGVLLIERAAARHVDLDADCVLYGQLETLAWFEAPATFAGLWSWSTIEAIPRQVWLLLVMATLAFAFVLLLFKELRIAAFDPGLATTQGIHAGVMHYALMIFVAAATVASFEAVGSILVIAMLIAPAATARLLTDRLGSQLLVSLVAALVCGAGGYLAATAIPAMFDADSVNAAGSMTVVAGLLVFAAALFSPSHGLVARGLRQRRLGRESALDDLLATLYRLREAGRPTPAISELQRRAAFDLSGASRLAIRRALVEPLNGSVRLTDAGLERATQLLRKHRLWESYLVEEAGLDAGHVHDTAEQLEHLPVEPKSLARTDPHGQPIPRRPQ